MPIETEISEDESGLGERQAAPMPMDAQLH
jgi:hypothetical protein